MTGQIYLLGDDAKLLEMREAPYDSESLLQGLLAKYPNLLAGEQMDLETPRRWVLVSREFGVPGEEDGANRWSLDHLFLDQDGVPTLVEVKRSTDTRIRREVVGQLLDYAANAVSYWSVEEIRSRFQSKCEDDGTSADDRLAELLGPEAVVDSFWERVKTNLQAGRVRMVFVADIIPAELRRVVEFLNRQMDPAEVLAVEIKQFVDEGQRLKTLVSTVIGQTVASQTKRSGGTTTPEKIAVEEYLQVISSTGSAERLKAVKSLIDWGTSNGCTMYCRRGTRDVVFIPGFVHENRITYPITCKHHGRLVFQMRFLVNHSPFDQPAIIAELQQQLEQIPGWNLRGGMDGLPYVMLDELKTDDDRQKLLKVLDWINVKLTAASKST
jgi:hypothetical protein